MTRNCPVCKTTLKDEGRSWQSDNKYGKYFSCDMCGEFILTDTLIEDMKPSMENTDKASLLSHVIRKMQKGSRYVFLTTYDVDNILKNAKLPNPGEQASNFIIWLGENLPGPGETIWVEPSKYQSIMGAKTPNGFGLVLKHLFNTGIVVGNLSEAINAPGRAHVTLSMKGWDYYDELKRGHIASRNAFMAMKFGDATLDIIYGSYFKPAVEKAGFNLFKLDDKPKAGLIDNRIRVEIRTSSFLISDLTHDNPGAYWEAGFAEGLGKPVIYTCEKGKFLRERTHFDTNHNMTVVWDSDNPQEAADLLKATIRATLPDIAVLLRIKRF